MAVVRGDADAYVHGGGQYEWDNCAPVGVATAAGLHCSTFDGTPFALQPLPPVRARLRHLRPEIADRVLAALDEIF